MRMVGPAIRLHGTPGEGTAPAPLLGEHTEEILGKLCGYSADAIARLRAEGAI